MFFFFIKQSWQVLSCQPAKITTRKEATACNPAREVFTWEERFKSTPLESSWLQKVKVQSNTLLNIIAGWYPFFITSSNKIGLLRDNLFFSSRHLEFFVIRYLIFFSTFVSEHFGSFYVVKQQLYWNHLQTIYHINITTWTQQLQLLHDDVCEM